MSQTHHKQIQDLRRKVKKYNDAIKQFKIFRGQLKPTSEFTDALAETIVKELTGKLEDKKSFSEDDFDNIDRYNKLHLFISNRSSYIQNNIALLENERQNILFEIDKLSGKGHQKVITPKPQVILPE